MKAHTRIVFIFVGSVAVLITIGAIFIYSSSSAYALERYGHSLFYLKKQLLGLLLGIMGAVFLYSIPLQRLKDTSPYLFLLTLCATSSTLLPYVGVSIHGSHRWLSLGGFSFQPSEFLKIFFIVYCAYFLEKKQFALHELKHYTQLVLITGITAGILLLQPDFGQMMTVSATAVLLFFLSHIPLRYLAMTALPVIPIIGLLVYLKPYRLHRILIYQNPWKDPQGAGFQIIQSLIAIGSGGWLGVGIAQSKQKFFYLPMHHTDFIFSIIAEETGFVGVTMLIAVYAAFLLSGFKIALSMQQQFSFLCVAGIVALVTLQSIINIGVACALLPTKGIGLPFISYGASSLVAHLCMVGIIGNCIKNNHARHPVSYH